jgi:tubulin polyglutamylase TTLL9
MSKDDANIDPDVDAQDNDDVPAVPFYPPVPIEFKKNRAPGPVKFATHFLNTLLDALKGLQWVKVREDQDWDLHWCNPAWMHDAFDKLQLPEYVRVCHFRNHYELTRKDLVVKNMKRFAKQLERDKGKEAAQRCDFVPTQYVLPQEYRMFVEEFKKSGGIWIMKPVGSAQGKGIFLIDNLSQIMDWKKDVRFTDHPPTVGGVPAREIDKDKADSGNSDVEAYIVGRYVGNPYLVGGKKFDLRIYCMVTSYRPLRAYLYRNAFARFASVPFSMESGTIANNVIHLTNVAVQKTAEGYDPRKGCKWQMYQLRRYLRTCHSHEAVEELFNRIDNVVLTTLQSVQHVMINDRRCFEIYGYDVLIDSELKPWLMEVNASPSLTADTAIDYCLKMGLLEDGMAIVDIEKLYASLRTVY